MLAKKGYSKLKLNNNDINLIAYNKARETKKSKYLWRACVGIVFSWFVSGIGIWIYGIATYGMRASWKNTSTQSYICNIIFFTILLIVMIVTLVSDNKTKNKILNELQKGGKYNE